MKKTIFALMLFMVVPLIGQTISFQAGIALKQYQFEDPLVYNILHKYNGLSQSISGVRVGTGVYIDFLLVNRLDCSFFYSKKELWRTTIPVTTADQPDGTGQTIDAIDQFYDYEVSITPKHYLSVIPNLQLGFGPTVGYGIYQKSFAIGSTETHSIQNEIIYGAELTFTFSIVSSVALRFDASYIRFKPSGTGIPSPTQSNSSVKLGTTGINTYVSDLGKWITNFGIQVNI